ncbi:hypothetical protein FQA39_LY12659 [Lamprigera yunnana]|nr:hypothetical protein FQA39_LY12659 [Lamprigera yunnana]
MDKSVGENDFENALNFLMTPQEPKRLCKALIEIRNNLEGPKGMVQEKIREIQEKGRLKALLSCLQQRKIHVINLSLSVITRCCVERSFVQLAVNRYSLLQHINSILKRSEDNSIRIRIFRVINNMCDHWDRFPNTVVEKEPQLHLILKIIDFLKGLEHLDLSDTEISADMKATIMLAVRILRGLANKQTVEQLINLGTLRAGGVLVNKFAPLWINNQMHQDMLLTVLKLLCCYSKCHSPKFFTELQEVQGGNPMDYIANMVLLCPFLVLKIMSNLSNVAKSRSDLPYDLISQYLIEKLQDVTTFPNGYEDKLFREYLKSLCFLIKNPGIRSNIKNFTLIPALVNVLNNLNSPNDITIKDCTLIIVTLSMYRFDLNLLSVILESSIAGVLLKKLDWLLGINLNADINHDFKLKIRRKFKKNSIVNQPTDVLNRLFSRDQIVERTTSPCSDISYSSGSLSPLSSPTMSEAEVSESDSDDYSPICSDEECDIFSQQDLDLISLLHDDEIESNSLGSNSTTDNSTMALKKDLVMEIVNLVKVFTTVRPAATELIDTPELLMKLLTLCFPWNKQFRPDDTLYCIMLFVKTPEYFISLMQTDFIVMVHKMTEFKHDSSCLTCADLYSTGKTILNKISYHIERKCGKGDIAHQLYRGTELVKRKIVSAIPFTVCNGKILNQLMKIGGAVNILLQMVQENTDLQCRSIISLCLFCHKLGIINPIHCRIPKDSTTTLDITPSTYKIDNECTKIVYFKLDDGSTIKADRKFLCEKSYYFGQLLSGTFKESQQEIVHLHNVSADSLKSLFLLMRFNIDNTKNYKIRVNFNTLLDVILLTDRYLLEEYCLCLTTSVQIFDLSPAVIPIIYQWSLESGTDILRIETVAYSLVGYMEDEEKITIFKSLLQPGLNEHFINDIRGLLDRYFH